MQKYSLKVSSPNEKSLKTFLVFFFKHLKIQFHTNQIQVPSQNKQKRVTLLKSPHVNKTAQEHFEVKMFSKHLIVNSHYSLKNLIVLKKILNRLFQDVAIQITLINDKNLHKKTKFLSLHPNNSKLFPNIFGKNSTKHLNAWAKTRRLDVKRASLLKVVKFLNRISLFGEMSISKQKSNV